MDMVSAERRAARIRADAPSAASGTVLVGEAGRDQTSRVVIPWLIRLRWMSLVALAAAAWAATVFWGVRLPTLWLAVLLAAMAATNAALVFELRSPAPRRSIMGGTLLLDAGLLTGVLYLVGGPLNPFSIVYLVGITMAAVTLGHRWATSLAIVSNLAYGLTFAYNRPFQFSDPSASGGLLALHLYGMWVALAAAAGLIAYFVSRIAEALEQREQELTASRAAAARSERLAALFALGAGAAHELATPLSTIRTAAIELERTLGTQPDALPGVHDFVGVIRGEVDRCTTVLDGLSGRAASASAADIGVPLSGLIAEVTTRLGEKQSRRLDVTLPDVPMPVTAPAEALCQVLVALLQNAFDASSVEQRVTLIVRQAPTFRAEIIDRGRGMAPEEAARAGEPFFSTKPAGAGLGLGLFLARAFADQMGGSLRWRSAVGEGTAVTLELPR
jgi:two-component system sensor histidine kinase RegB